MKKQAVGRALQHLFRATLLIGLTFVHVQALPDVFGQRSRPVSKASQRPLRSTAGLGAHAIIARSAPKAPQVVLYDQYNNASTTATLSATFTDSPTFSADLADDFVVPAGQAWNVQSIDADGQYFNGPGPATSWNVFIYANNGGLPGALIYSTLNQPVSVNGTTFTVNLSPAAVLSAGTYWIEIQANMTFGTQGEWGWTDRTVQSNNPAAWQNPGGGFGVCPTWMPKLANCVPTAGGPDQVFRLNGTSTPSPWTALANPFPHGFADTCALLTDGTVMCHEYLSTAWHRLKPDINGSYQNGTWDVPGFTVPNMPNGIDPACPAPGCPYAPLFFASAVLRDGRVVVIGGEYINGINGGNGVWSNIGFLYDPVANTWSAQITVPANWTGTGGPGTGGIGDAQSTILQNGTMLLARTSVGAANTWDIAFFNPATLTFTALGPAGKGDSNDEENWNILPNGKVLTVDSRIQQRSQVYNSATNAWEAAVNTQVNLADTGAGTANSREVGPGVLRPDGTMIYFSGTNSGRNAVYNTATGTWAATGAVGDFPLAPGQMYHFAVPDGPASLLPNGKVLVMANPVPTMLPVFNRPSHFYEFDGTNLTQVADSPNAASFIAYQGRMLLLPSGEVLLTAYNQGADQFELLPKPGTKTRTKTPGVAVQDVVLYSNGGAPQDAWRPVITAAPATVNGGITYRISGMVFNGFSEGAGYGNDAQTSTNYPLVRIINHATGHVFYARTHDHTRMGVELVGSNEIITTFFDVPVNIEAGPSDLVVVANGIPSQPIVITAGPAIDHFKAYKVSPTPPPLNEPVMLQDQFDYPSFDNRIVLEPFRFANPVQKDRAGNITPITNPDSHLKLYNLNAVPTPPPRTVTVANQFGLQTLTVQGSELLAVPTQKNGIGTVHDLDHFKCYDCTGNPVNVVVNLTDQFHFEPQVLVLQPRYFCNPVLKIHNNITTPILYPDAHLVFYAINQQPPFNIAVNTLNQFGPEFNLPLQDADLLAVPSSKVSIAAASITNAVSRKVHGGAGTFDIQMPLTGGSGVECRTTGGTNDFTLVVTFNGNVAVTGTPQAQVTSGTGCVGSAGVCTGNVLVSGAVVTIPLTTIANAQVINVRINSVNSVGSDAPATDFDIPMGFLIGDTDNNRAVNAADISQTKSRSGQAVDGTNFRSDVNANGSINASDVALTKQYSGTSLPPN